MIDFGAPIELSEYKPDGSVNYKGQIDCKIINTPPHERLLEFLIPPKQESDNARDALFVYSCFKLEIMRKRFKRSNTTQQAQELAEKISRDLGIEPCPIKIDRFELDEDGQICLDVTLLV